MKLLNYILALSLILSSNACRTIVDPPEPVQPSTDQNLVLSFKPLFKQSALNWSVSYVTNANDTIQFDKLKFILSNFILEKTDGTLLPINNAYAYLDLKDGRDSVTIKVPVGDYKSIRMTLGLDSNINHSDPTVWGLDHPLSPALNEMHWGWAGGYIFNIIEGYYRKNNTNAGFSFHIANDNNVRIFSFVQDFSITKPSRALFNVHADKYFNNVNNFSLINDGSFSHSGDVDPIMDKFIQNLNGLFELKSIN